MPRSYETSKIIDNVLKAVVVTGMMGSLIIAPNAAQLGGVILKKLDKRSRARSVRSLTGYMAQQNLIIIRDLPDRRLEIKLTEKGKQRVERVQFESLKIAVPKQWDGKWRLVLFDIPERWRASRSALSLKLRGMGFHQLQKSAWIYPYACSKEIELIKQVFSIRPQYITVAEVDYLDRQEELRRHFKL